MTFASVVAPTSSKFQQAAHAFFVLRRAIKEEAAEAVIEVLRRNQERLNYLAQTS